MCIMREKDWVISIPENDGKNILSQFLDTTGPKIGPPWYTGELILNIHPISVYMKL